jgi:hypothetical protein
MAGQASVCRDQGSRSAYPQMDHGPCARADPQPPASEEIIRQVLDEAS